MQNIVTVSDLKTAIQQLENRQANELVLLKVQFHNTIESFKPLNVLKSTFNEATSSPTFKDTVLGTSVGLTAGYISKALLVGASINPIKKLLGSLLQLGITNVIAKNPDAVRAVSDKLTNLFNKKAVPENQ